jgi:hypothetical protein
LPALVGVQVFLDPDRLAVSKCAHIGQPYLDVGTASGPGPPHSHHQQHAIASFLDLLDLNLQSGHGAQPVREVGADLARAAVGRGGRMLARYHPLDIRVNFFKQRVDVAVVPVLHPAAHVLRVGAPNCSGFAACRLVWAGAARRRHLHVSRRSR